MTEIEIETQAEDYAVEHWEHCEEGQTDYKAINKAFKAGAKWMQEHAIEWHDLRKDPKNLPIENGEYWSNIGLVVFYCTDSNHSWFTPLCEACDDQEDVSDEVLAWCELPQFKHKE